MDRDEYARWLQLRLRQAYAIPPRDPGPEDLLDLARRAERALAEHLGDAKPS